MSTDASTVASAFKIYTKTGDKGQSSLYNGQRLPKDDRIFHALGDVDELNSAIGVAREFCKDTHVMISEHLEQIQSRLLDVGSAVATPLNNSASSKLQRARFGSQHIATVEEWIDQLSDRLPPLKNFILPSGGKASAFLHAARSTCRRAERSIVPLVRDQLVDNDVGIYVNRLSDYLFTAARYACQTDGEAEVIYKKA